MAKKKQEIPTTKFIVCSLDKLKNAIENIEDEIKGLYIDDHSPNSDDLPITVYQDDDGGVKIEADVPCTALVHVEAVSD